MRVSSNAFVLQIDSSHITNVQLPLISFTATGAEITRFNARLSIAMLALLLALPIDGIVPFELFAIAVGAMPLPLPLTAIE